MQSEDEVLALVPSGDSTEASAEARLDLAALEQALEALPEHYRTAVVLRDVYGMSIEEISERVGISESAAKVRVHRGRKRVKELMFSTREIRD